MKAKLFLILLTSVIFIITACSGKISESSNIKSVSESDTYDSFSSSNVGSTSFSVSSIVEENSNTETDVSNSTAYSSSGNDEDGYEKALSTDKSDPQKPAEYAYTLKNAELTGELLATSISSFGAEGYGATTTGGGNIQPGHSDYIQVSTAAEFIKAIGRSNYSDKNDTDFATRPMVVEVMNDLDLGWNVIGSTAQGYSDVASAYAPQIHPNLKVSGISLIYITARQNLTIFSKNGAVIKHACFQIRGRDNKASKNIIIRNLKFIGAWEWDDKGSYDKNDWDIFTLRADNGEVSNIWIDHCTFTKPYDGTIDVKYAAKNITVSWCAFIPYDTEDSDFLDMMDYLEQNRSSFVNYNSARNSGATFEDMINYASINKKVHLIGHTDNFSGDEVIRVTYANNYYKNCTERIPRLRLGKAHVYNCIIDSTDANNLENSLNSRGIKFPDGLAFASNGSLGTNHGELLLENCHISGVMTPLRNNNSGKAADEFVGAVDALYTYYTTENINRNAKYGTAGNIVHNGRYTFLGHSTKNDGNLMTPFPSTPLAFDTDKFKSGLDYEYILYNPPELYLVLNGNVGAGKMDFTVSQWLRSIYQLNETVSNELPKTSIRGSTANKNASRP